MRIAGMFMATALTLAGCGTSASTDPNDNTPDVKPSTGTEVRSDKVRNTSPDVAGTTVEELVSGNSDFAFDMYAQLKTGTGNLFYSPYSVSIALAMTYAGAATDTLTEMADTLHFTLPEPDLHPAFNALDLDLASRSHSPDGGEGAGLTLKIADALWGQNGYGFLVPFLDTLAVNYGAGMHLVDFSTQTEEARLAINQWVSDQTEARIPELLMPGTLSPLARLVLTNAIYFKAQWAEPFVKDFTANGVFHLLSGDTVTVAMMRGEQEGPRNYTAGDGYQAVELPYDGNETSMLVVLPDAGRFTEIESAFDATMLARLVADLQPAELGVVLPKWSFRSKFSLKEQLTALRMPDAFVYTVADFSRMDGTRELFIGDVIHEAFVAVDEDGTEAAAATAVVMVGGSMPPPELEVNRPFLFVIRDNITGTILFVGRVLNPAA